MDLSPLSTLFHAAEAEEDEIEVVLSKYLESSKDRNPCY
jgi:uncharacterized protein (DUF1810 family)